ncbi:MAG: POTRA domain-containing protein [Bdellovibrionales bacterium]
MRPWRFLTLSLCLAVQAVSLAYAQNRNLQYFGVLPDDQKLIEKKYPSTSNMDLETVDELLASLFKTNHYEVVEARRGKNGGVAIVARPIEIVTDIEISGNGEMSRREILEKLGLVEGKGLPRKQILEQSDQIIEAYKKIGYLNAKINISFDNSVQGQAKVKIDIQEGRPCIVKAIEIETPNQALKNKLSSLVRGELEEEYRSTLSENIQQQFTDYFVEERYLNATIVEPEIHFSENKEEAYLKFTIENPYRYFVIYEGNTFYDSSRISKLLRLNTNERLGLNPSAELADRLRMVYLKAGFANVKVTFEEKILTGEFTKKLKLKIEESLRVRIKKIEVNGKISKDSNFYEEFIEEHSSDLIDLGYYNTEDFEVGYKNLITELQNQGYLQAKLLSSRAEFQQRGQFVIIRVFIDEGPQTYIKNITFKGLNAFSSDTLLNIVRMKQGDPLSLNTLESSLPKLKEFYASKGYLDMKVLDDPSKLISYNETNTEAAVEFDIQEGPQVVVNSILIQGNGMTKDDVILKEIEFKPTDILTSQNLSDSEFRLQRLGLFSSVAIRTIEKDSSIAQRTVVIEVAERNPGLFNFGAIVNNELGEEYGVSILGYTGIAYRNLGGTARAISTRAEVNVNLQTRFVEHDINAGYLEPFIFGDRIRGRVNLNRSMKIFKVEKDQLIGLETNQITTSLDKDLSRTVKFSWNTWSLATTRKFQAVKINTDKTFAEEKLTIATIGPTLEWDKRDNPFSPTTGLFYRFNGEYSDPLLGSTSTMERAVKYYKVNSTFNTYARLYGPRLVWANSVRGGYLQNLSDKSQGQVPEEAMFSIGGRSTIRGYEPASIPPREEFTQKLGLTNSAGETIPMFVKTDSHYYLFKSEFRFPLYGEVGGVIFYDGGSVRISGIRFNDEYRDAWGVGIRYNTPVGPISAEMAWKLDRNKDTQGNDESPSRFHFSIGAF